MSEEEKNTSEQNDSSIYYVLGGVVLVAAVAGFFLLRPKETVSNVAPVASAPIAAPTPGPITKFACEKAYYNPVIGFPKYYVTQQGVDTVTSGDVTCTFTFTVKDKVVLTTTQTATLNEVPERGGAVFKCQTQAVEMTKGVPTKVDVKVENPNKATIACTQSFIFP